MKRVRVDPSGLRPAALTPPVSKSDAHRALTLAFARGAAPGLEAAGEGWPTDVEVVRDGLATLGAEPGPTPATIDCRDGGAPFRILLGQAAVTPGARVRFVGTPRLGERPHRPLLDALRDALGPAGLLLEEGAPWPLTVRGADRAPAGPFRVEARESSQFATSLLLAAARLAVREGRPFAVELVGSTASQGYLDITLGWLRRYGFDVAVAGSAITVGPGSAPAAPPPVPGDWSSIAYLLVVAWRAGGRVRSVDPAALHPDREILRVLAEVGLATSFDADGASVVGVPRAGARASGETCPDLLPTLAALACALPAPTVLTEVSVLRHKESDRLAGIEALVRAGGGRTTSSGDALVVEPGPAPDLLEVDSRGDHRLAMSAAVLSVLTGRPLVLSDPDCVTKSFPGFWRELGAAGVRTDPA